MSKFTRRWPAGIPLRLRLTLWYTVSLALITFTFATFIYFQIQANLTTQVDVGLEIVTTQAIISLVEEDERLHFHNIENNPTFANNLNDNYVIHLLAPDGSIWAKLGDDDEAILFKTNTVGYMTRLINGERWRIYNQPIRIGRTNGWLQVIQELDPVERILQNLQTQIVSGILATLIFAGLGGYLLAYRALKPINHITHLAQDINSRELDQRIEYVGPADEVGQLAATFDKMLARLHEAFERERHFTSNASHELRTPLTALKGRIDVTLSQPRQPEIYIETLTEMEQQVDRLIHLSNDLLLMTSLEQGQQQEKIEKVELDDFLQAIIDQVRPLAKLKDIQLDENIPSNIVVEGHINLLIRLFLNLLDNAIKYTPQNGRVTIQAKPTPHEIQVIINDTGPGIPDKHLPHIFERFYRVENDRARNWRGNNGRSGSGLGLAIAHEIARIHHGNLTISSPKGQGTTCTFHWPLVLA